MVKIKDKIRIERCKKTIKRKVKFSKIKEICDNSTKAIVLKSVTKGWGYQKVLKMCDVIYGGPLGYRGRCRGRCRSRS